MSDEQNLINKMDEIFNILTELKSNQLKQFSILQKNETKIIKKIDKLQEYNEIDDMVNALFDKRLSNIEHNI